MESQGVAPAPTPNAPAPNAPAPNAPAANAPAAAASAAATAAAPAPTAAAPIPPAKVLTSNPNSKYADDIKKVQRIEAVALSLILLIALGATFYLWQFSASPWCCFVLAGLAGIIAGLLHSLKWFYRTVGDGEWEIDRAWWRYLNPLVSGVMGVSIYIVLRSGLDKGQTTLTANKDALVAYSVGFLTGLFADNAMGKLRDIAHVLFGPAGTSKAKPTTPASGATGKP